MNSFRIGLIGVTVEYWGRSMAEGFVHEFEGWIIFVACSGLLIGLMWILARIGRRRLALRAAFGIEFPRAPPPNAEVRLRSLPAPLIGSIGLLAGAYLAAMAVPKQVEYAPERSDLLYFPMTLGPWQGRAARIDPVILEVLKADDTISADYARVGSAPVNLHIAYFATQSRGTATHSPLVCIPGAGWEIAKLEERTLPNVLLNGAPVRVNRAVIRKSDATQLVYYWFKQNQRMATRDYVAKWFILADSLLRHRSDGALVRLITPISQEAPEAADERLSAFAAALIPELPRYVPD